MEEEEEEDEEAGRQYLLGMRLRPPSVWLRASVAAAVEAAVAWE
jgi:hypothetical protein